MNEYVVLLLMSLTFELETNIEDSGNQSAPSVHPILENLYYIFLQVDKMRWGAKPWSNYQAVESSTSPLKKPSPCPFATQDRCKFSCVGLFSNLVLNFLNGHTFQTSRNLAQNADS